MHVELSFLTRSFFTVYNIGYKKKKHAYQFVSKITGSIFFAFAWFQLFQNLNVENLLADFTNTIEPMVRD